MMRNICAAILTVMLLLAGGFTLSSELIAPSVLLAAGTAEPIDLNSATADQLKALRAASLDRHLREVSTSQGPEIVLVGRVTPCAPS